MEERCGHCQCKLSSGYHEQDCPVRQGEQVFVAKFSSGEHYEPAAMVLTDSKLYLVHDHDRWGSSINVVRARNGDEARALVTSSKSDRVEVTELKVDGPAAILWCWDNSPDSRPERD